MFGKRGFRVLLIDGALLMKAMSVLSEQPAVPNSYVIVLTR